MMEVYLTDVGKTGIQEHHPQGIVWEYDVDKPFKLLNMTDKYWEVTYLGIPYTIPFNVDGKPTIKKPRAR